MFNIHISIYNSFITTSHNQNLLVAIYCHFIKGLLQGRLTAHCTCMYMRPDLTNLLQIHIMSIMIFIASQQKYHNTTAKSWLVCFFWGLSEVQECSGVHWVSLVGLHWLLLCWKSSPNSMIYVDYGFSYILWQFEFNEALSMAI